MTHRTVHDKIEGVRKSSYWAVLEVLAEDASEQVRRELRIRGLDLHESAMESYILRMRRY